MTRQILLDADAVAVKLLSLANPACLPERCPRRYSRCLWHVLEITGRIILGRHYLVFLALGLLSGSFVISFPQHNVGVVCNLPGAEFIRSRILTAS
jgi:hypothetical protein